MATQEQLRDVELQKIADGSKAWNDAGRFGVAEASLKHVADIAGYPLNRKE